jgi:protein phosphatase PTC7
MTFTNTLRPLLGALTRKSVSNHAKRRIASTAPHLIRSFSSAEPSQDDASSAPTAPTLPIPAFAQKVDEHKEEQKRRRLSEVKISEVLQAKHSFRWVDPVISRTSTVEEAIIACIEGGLSGMMVVETLNEGEKKVVGLTTSRDLLRILAAKLREGEPANAIMKEQMGDYMTPISQVIFCRPEETVGMCRTIMAKLGIKCIPVLSKEGRVEGLITAKDMSDFGLDAKDRGGKTNFLRDISERVGLSSNTSMAEPPPYLQAHMALEQTPLYMNVGVAELPHPFKTPDGVGMNHRDFGPEDFATDPKLSEDSWFVSQVLLPDERGENLRNAVYLGVADGVGSWRQYGVDPREFSHKLMEECKNILAEASANATLGGKKFRRMISPPEILAQAHERVKADNIIGSTTACVALFDNVRHQLHFSNLGDSGIIVLRHIDSDVAGSLKRDRETPRSDRKSDLRVAFVSQQQLKSFNHPFQLGWTGRELDESEGHSFKTAKDSCTTSIHVRRGDIIIMATDGLFDNLEVDDIAQTALEWEQQYGFIRGGDIMARERRWAMGNSLTVLSSEVIEDLATKLCKQAREKSLDPTTDSPFAILAKENDIMWSGGMPDDCTVIAMHVVGRSPHDKMDKDHQ